MLQQFSDSGIWLISLIQNNTVDNSTTIHQEVMILRHNRALQKTDYTI